MIQFFKFLFALFRGVYRNNRFLRLSPNLKGRIFFYDRKNANFFIVNSRGNIDSVTANQIFLNNEYDTNDLIRNNDIIETYSKILSNKKIPLIIDCGGNIGLTSKFFSFEYPQSKIICIEPEINNFNQAIINCKDLVNISFLNCAIGSSPGYVKILNPEEDPNAFRTEYYESDKGIHVKTINQLINENLNCELFIVKIDIEGFEEDLFSKNLEWIDKCPIMFVELHDWMLPKSMVSKNFINAISNKNRDFINRKETIVSLKNSFMV